MGLVVRTNNSANNACRNLKNNQRDNTNMLEKLASGYQINRAADDASGLAISEKMWAQITALETYDDNCENGISLIQTAEGYMEEVHNMLQRCVELSGRAANGILTDKERVMIQEEVDQIGSEIDRISDTANFNGLLLLHGKIGVDVAAKQNPPTIVGDAPTWAQFDSATAANGTLAATYQNPNYTDSNGNLYTFSAAVIDFSSFTASDIPASDGKGFYTTCCTCDAHYSFKFTNSTTSSIERSDRHFIYNIGIADATSADDIYDKIIDITRGGNPNNHYTEIVKENGKLIFYDNRPGQTPSKSNGRGLFDAGIAVSADTPGLNFATGVAINAGVQKPGKIYINLEEVSTYSLGIAGANVLNSENAAEAMNTYRTAIDQLSIKRANLGAKQNRLEYTIENIENAAENVSAAKSRIKDTDMAKMMMEYTKTNVLTQSAQAMLAQANTQPQNVLSLLQ